MYYFLILIVHLKNAFDNNNYNCIKTSSFLTKGTKCFYTLFTIISRKLKSIVLVNNHFAPKSVNYHIEQL